MNEVLIPEWIKERKAQQEKKELERRSIIMSESLMRAEAPSLWDEFIRELAIQCEGCKTLSEILRATLDNVSQTDPPDKAFKFTIYGSKPFGPLLSTVVRVKLEFSRPYIECLREAEDHGRDYKIFFHVDLLGRACFMTPYGQSTPKMAAEYVVKDMIRDLDSGVLE
jgi:hypothetical protein